MEERSRHQGRREKVRGRAGQLIMVRNKSGIKGGEGRKIMRRRTKIR